MSISPSLITPTTRPSGQTTGIPLTPRSASRLATSLNRSSGAAVTTSRVMTSPTISLSASTLHPSAFALLWRLGLAGVACQDHTTAPGRHP